jgi:Ig-like domain from next to BRCA1 gene
MKRDTVIFVVIGVVLVCLVLTASATALLLVRSRATPTSQAALYTQAAGTFVADLTQQAFETLVAEATQGVPTDTPGVPAPSSVVPTVAPPSATLVIPTAVPPSTTPTQVFPTSPPPTITPIPVRCNQAHFIKDVTVPDGTVFTPGTEFTKVWRLQNTGSCTWDGSYAFVFVGGNRLGASPSVPLPKVVNPGENVDIGVEMIAPSGSGSYQGNWMLSNANGKTFGVGSDAQTPVWVDIRVTTPNQNFAYDLALNACLATWRSSAGSLPCPGNPQSSNGSVVIVTDPILENGRHENEPGLSTRPQPVNGGWISGVYPAYKVKENDHFVTQIGCAYGYTECELAFTLSYVIGTNSPKSLGRWYEKYEGLVYTVDVDLTALAGKDVQLILGVENLGKGSQAQGIWFVPSVRQGKPSPTPTSTRPAPTPTRTATPPSVTPTWPPDQATPTVPPSPYPYP